MTQIDRRQLVSFFRYAFILATVVMNINQIGAQQMPPVPGFNGTVPIVSSYCGFLDASGVASCDPNATVCETDSDCLNVSNYTSCLTDCGPQISAYESGNVDASNVTVCRYACMQGFHCENGECVSDTESATNSSSACDYVNCGINPAYQCVNGECVDTSCDAIRCKQGYFCQYGACVPTNATFSATNSSSACDYVNCGINPAYQCVNGECVDTSCDAIRCKQGYFCQYGACVPTNATSSNVDAANFTVCNKMCIRDFHCENGECVPDDENATYSGCLVGGDMMIVPGHSYGSVIGILCYDKSSYVGKETICGTNGSMVDIENNYTCSSDSPYCVQCGEESAICVSNVTAATEGCASRSVGSTNGYPAMNATVDSYTNNTSNSELGCLVGDIMYTPKQSIGQIGFLCQDSNVYYGKESFCGKNGSVYDVEKNITCPEKAPYCFQCGESAYGAAICLSSKTAVQDGCALGGVESSSLGSSLFGGLNASNITNILSNVKDNTGILSTAEGILGSLTGGNNSRSNENSAAIGTSAAASYAHLSIVSVIVLLVGCTWSI